MPLTLLRPDCPNDAAPRSYLDDCHPRPVNGYSSTVSRMAANGTYSPCHHPHRPASPPRAPATRLRPAYPPAPPTGSPKRSHTAPQVANCPASTARATISVSALLALARWCQSRRSPEGVIPCNYPNVDRRPPANTDSPSGQRHPSPLEPTPRRSARATRPRRRATPSLLVGIRVPGGVRAIMHPLTPCPLFVGNSK
jgi:hypothetical protein